MNQILLLFFCVPKRVYYAIRNVEGATDIPLWNGRLTSLDAKSPTSCELITIQMENKGEELNQYQNPFTGSF
jgi:hypothetical protein